MEYNFGYSFLYRLDTPLNNAILTITNKDTKDIRLVCVYGYPDLFVGCVNCEGGKEEDQLPLCCVGGHNQLEA